MERFDDPRWRGAVAHTLNTGDIDFRAVYTTDSLFLSWKVNGDPTLDKNGDQIWVTLKESSGAAIVLQFILTLDVDGLNAAPQPGAIQDPLGFQVFRYAPGARTPQQIIPTDATYPPWLDGLTAAWTKKTDGTYWWGIQTVIPIAPAGLPAGIAITSPFDMWYVAFVVKPDLDPQQPPVTVEYRWPETLEQIYDATNQQIVYPDPALATNWSTLSLGTTGSCAGDVALTPLDVGTEGAGASPESEIRFTDPGTGATPVPNAISTVFVARPQNVRPTGDPALPAGSIRAQFFIADWGSVVPGVTSLWHEIEPLISKTNDGAIPQSPPAHGDPNRNDIHFPWLVGDPERCDYIEDLPLRTGCTQRGRKHQCMFVQLSGTGTTGLVFRNQSVYRNMDFAHMSLLERAADVSIVGLTPIPERPARDVYLHVETTNMPRWSKSSATPRRGVVVVDGADRRIIAGRDTMLTLWWGLIRLGRGDTATIPTKDSIALSQRAGRGDSVRAAASSGRLTEREVDSLMPTYRVHVYHATGHTITLDGVRRGVLEPQTSFGYWLIHDHEVIGWRHALAGNGLVQVGPHAYKISVPNNSFATVTTTIEPLDAKPFAGSLHGGIAVPYGSFKNLARSGFGGTADFERRLNGTVTLAVLFGRYRFDRVGSNGHLEIQHFSGSLGITFGSGPLRYLFGAGGGTYRFINGGSNTGTHASAGVEFEIRYIGIGAEYRLHRIFTPGTVTTFSTIQLGGRARF